MHPLEELFFILLMSDAAWGVLAALYLVIVMPIIYLVFRKKDKK